MLEQSNFIALYESAFPEIERRPTAHEIAMTDPRFEIRIIRQNDGTFAGFITLWHFSDFDYVEHFAMLPALRGGGLGSQTLQTLQKESTKPIVLEIELPENDLSRRRMSFYQRNGFSAMPQHYEQPSYAPALPSLPLMIMTTATNHSDKFFDIVKKTLYHEVYKVD